MTGYGVHPQELQVILDYVTEGVVFEKLLKNWLFLRRYYVEKTLLKRACNWNIFTTQIYRVSILRTIAAGFHITVFNYLSLKLPYLQEISLDALELWPVYQLSTVGASFPTTTVISYRSDTVTPWKISSQSLKLPYLHEISLNALEHELGPPRAPLHRHRLQIDY